MLDTICPEQGIDVSIQQVAESGTGCIIMYITLHASTFSSCCGIQCLHNQNVKWQMQMDYHGLSRTSCLQIISLRENWFTLINEQSQLCQVFASCSKNLTFSCRKNLFRFINQLQENCYSLYIQAICHFGTSAVILILASSYFG